jgi:hypothetical protein
VFLAFTTQEFPGRTFSSLEELEAAREEQRKLRRELDGETIVTVERVGDSPEE